MEADSKTQIAAEQESVKKPYASPRLEVHGSVETLTRGTDDLTGPAGIDGFSTDADNA